MRSGSWWAIESFVTISNSSLENLTAMVHSDVLLSQFFLLRRLKVRKGRMGSQENSVDRATLDCSINIRSSYHITSGRFCPETNIT